MTEKEYRYVSSIAECGNITRAAEKLYIAQPSLTQALHRIEEDYGARLFDRNRDGMRLTEEGRSWLDAAEQMFSIYEELKRELGNVSGNRRGKLALGVESFQSDWLFSRFLMEYVRRYPGMSLRVTEHPAGRLQELLMDGKLDILLIHYPFANENLARIPLYDDELVLAVHAENEDYVRMASEQEKIPVANAELMARQRFLMPDSSQQIRQAAENICMAAGLEPQIRYTSTNMLTVLALVSAGAGAAIVPMEECLRFASVYPVAFFRFPENWNGLWRLVAAYRGEQVLEEPARNLIELIRMQTGGAV